MKQVKKLLIVEDEKILLDLYSSIFTNKSANYTFQVTKSTSTEMALDILKQNEFDLVFTDYHLPGKDGLHLIDYIKKNFPKTLCILISAYLSPQIIRNAFSTGVLTCLKKPTSISTILQTVEKAFNMKNKKSELYDFIFSIFSGYAEKCLFIDPDQTIIFTNKAFQYEYGDQNGKKCYQIICTNQKKCDNCPITANMKPNEEKVLIRSMRSAKGNLTEIKELIEPWINRDGELFGYLVFLYQHLKQPEKKPSYEKERIYQEKGKNRYFIFILDQDDRIVYSDSNFNKLCEVNKNKIKYKNICDLFHSYFSEYLKKNSITFYQFVKQNLDKRMNIDFVRQKSKQRIKITCEFRDISEINKPNLQIMVTGCEMDEKHEISRLIEFEKESSKQLLSGQFDMVISLDKQNCIRTINNVMEKKFNIKKAELIGEPVDNFIQKKRDIQAFHQALRQVQSLRDVFGLRIDIMIKEKNVPCLINISGVRDSYNNDIGIVLVLRDIEKDLKMEATLSNIERMQALGQLAAGMSHQINNYTSTISGTTELMMLDLMDSGNVPADIYKLIENYMKTIHSSLKKLSDLTHHLTKFAKAQQVPAISLGSVNKVVKDVLILTTAKVKKKCIIVKSDFYENLPQVYFSPIHLEQAVLNIVMNAIDAVPEQKGIVQVSTYKDNSWACICIKDNGYGIAENHQLSRIFDAFYTTKPSGVGTGLGLNIARDVIASFKGTIEVNSKKDEGTTMTIKLPILDEGESI